MPNATERANAQTLPEATNRRDFLSAVLAAGGVASLPSVAAASVARSRHPDADLFERIKRAKTADSIATDADIYADNLWGEKTPPFPQALVWTESDAPRWYGVKSGKRIPDRDIDFLRIWLSLARKPDPTKYGDLGPVYPTLDFIERAREIVKTKDKYDAAYQAADEHPDVLDAKDRSESLTGQWEELAMRDCEDPSENPGGPNRQAPHDCMRIYRGRPRRIR
jgi:hypothetical protein